MFVIQIPIETKKVYILIFTCCVCIFLGNFVNRVCAQVGMPMSEHQKEAYFVIEQDGTPDAFYRVIIEYNLFRPLGWTPPHPQPVYRLLGTFISIEGTESQAILQVIASKQLHFLKVGDSIGGAEVTEILSKQMTLQQPEQILTLKLDRQQFLSPSRASARREAASSHSDTETAQEQTYKSPENPAYQIQTVSKTERSRLIQKYWKNR